MPVDTMIKVLEGFNPNLVRLRQQSDQDAVRRFQTLSIPTWFD
ncbi:hypothetical protein THTE_4439 [Thermogutta terrifontis]|uniref:Uncharacterized protein n=1 Tax=Thermogutta terrifontis TaxID=1331910 RepID=A0A286RM63_9BACT|nr:hypothetical protein THTE_4439 [Thermogutta terrifontis]